MSRRVKAELDGVSVVFESAADGSGTPYRFTALDGVSLPFFTGELHTILGENGAGKSTLVHVLSGLQAPSAGTVIVDGKPASFTSPADALERGIAMVHQRPELSDELTVLENIALGSHDLFVGRAGKRREIMELAALWEIGLDLDARVRELSPADRLRAALLGALFAKPSLLILDEPTAVLDAGDRTLFMEAAGRARDRGLGIILITHKIAEALHWSDRISVLRKGRLEHSAPMLDGGGKPLIDSAMLEAWLDAPAVGDIRKDGLSSPPPAAESDPPSFSVDGLSAAPANRPPVTAISFSARQGTITGIFGHPGSGMGTLEDSLSGMIRPYSGVVTIRTSRGTDGGARSGGPATAARRGKPVTDARHSEPAIAAHGQFTVSLGPSTLTPRRLRENGVALVPSNRAYRGSHPDLTIADCLLAYRSRTWIMNREQDEAFVAAVLEREGIPAAPERLARTLSGGQLQRLILARELASNPAILILTEPEWGLDIRSAALLRERLVEAARAGMAVIVLTDTPDTMAIAGFYDTILRLKEGHLS